MTNAWTSGHGMGLVLSSPKRLVDEFSIRSEVEVVTPVTASLSRSGNDQMIETQCRHNAWRVATSHWLDRGRFDESVIERHVRLSISPGAIICGTAVIDRQALASFPPPSTLPYAAGHRLAAAHLQSCLRNSGCLPERNLATIPRCQESANRLTKCSMPASGCGAGRVINCPGVRPICECR